MADGVGSTKLLWPAVDLGGTSIRLLAVADTDAGPAAVIRADVPTPKGIPAIVEALGDLLGKAASEAASRGMSMAPVLAIGSPGRIVTSSNGERAIAPRSAANLEAFTGELDGVDLADELAVGLGLEKDRVFWENDAVVQGRQLIGGLLDDPVKAEIIREQVVVCINPGTGLGGCLAEVGPDRIEVFTDGHISELLLHPVEVKRDLGGIPTAVRSSADGAVIGIELWTDRAVATREIASPELKQAEDFLSGRGLTRIAVGVEDCRAELDAERSCFGPAAGGVEGRRISELIEGGGSDIPSQAARFIGDLGGVALARLMTLLHEGRAFKTSSFPDWSAEDRERLRGVTRFILGGGVSSTPLGRYMIAVARARLAGWPELHLLECETSADAGALGAFSLIPEAMRRALEANGGRPHQPWTK